MHIKALILVGILCSAYPALAHDIKGPNGGRVADAGRYHVELVAKDTVLDLFVADTANQPVKPEGFKGVAILIVDGKSQRIPLEPADNRKLSGIATTKLPGNPKGVVQLTLPDGKTAQARFN
jgi:hypothetical protein